MSKATIYTIAKEAGVSTATVSKILNNKGNISKATTDRVMELIKELNYIPQQQKQRGNAIGFVSFLTEEAPLGSPFVARLLSGICAEAYRQDREITLIDGKKLVNLSPEELHWFYAKNSLLGLLCANIAGDAPFCDRLRASDIPFVLTANATENGNYVTTCNYESVSEMIDYIICMGHRKIAFVGLVTEQLESHRQRFEAYKKTLMKYNIPLEEDFIVDLPNANRITIKNAVSRLFARPKTPTALFFASEELTPIISQLEQLDIKIPEDISIAGMGLDDPESSIYPDLAVIVQPVEELGKAAVKSLEKSLDTEKFNHKIMENLVYYGDTIKRI